MSASTRVSSSVLALLAAFAPGGCVEQEPLPSRTTSLKVNVTAPADVGSQAAPLPDGTYEVIDGFRRLDPMNSIGWIVGHLAWHEQRYFVTRAQGLTPVPVLNELVANGAPLEGIVKGLHRALASRVAALARGASAGGLDVLMSGGVALNGAMVEALREALGRPVAVVPEPQLVGALGAALSVLPGAPAA